MWDVLKYLVVVIVIVYATVWWFGEGWEQNRLKEMNTAVKKFYEAQNRYPDTIEELEKLGYIPKFTNRDRPPKNGEWGIDPERGCAFILRYKCDAQGNKLKDEDGNYITHREYAK